MIKGNKERGEGSNGSVLPAHLEKFARAVAEGYSHVEAAETCGYSRGSASFLFSRPGVNERIVKLLAIREKATEKEVAENASRRGPTVAITQRAIIDGLAQEASTSKSAVARVGAWRALAEIHAMQTRKLEKVLEFGEWTKSELLEYALTGEVPSRIMEAFRADKP